VADSADGPPTSRVAGEPIAVPSLPNLRELGGWPTSDGIVRRGAVFRSVELGAVDPSDPTLASLGLEVVYDLRTDLERASRPDRRPPGVTEVVLDVLADASGAAPADLLAIFDDPDAANEALGDGRAVGLLEDAYREIVDLPSARRSYRELFEGLADPRRRPALFHCTTGKDRTGWASAALLTLLGVGRDDVEREYLLTNDQLLPALEPLLVSFANKGGDPDLLRPVLGVDRRYLDAAFDEVERTYGSMDGYFAQGLEVSPATVQQLRAQLVERSSTDPRSTTVEPEKELAT